MSSLINCKGKLIDLSVPKVMGILNATPDSFYDGGKYPSREEILKKTELMLKEGADFIDIGAYSSRPNAAFVSETEELERLVPVVDLVLQYFPEMLVSIDTFRSEVAKAALQHGAAMINDISAGLLDQNMLNVIADFQVPYIMMHMRGTPETMSTLTTYDAIIKDMLYYFSERISAARKLGINDLIIDPGFGFAKTLDQNYEVLQHLDLFQILDLPVLSAVSRKSMIYKTLDSNAEDALNGTTVLNTISLLKGAKILRVHDVKPAVECVRLFSRLPS